MTANYCPPDTPPALLPDTETTAERRVREAVVFHRGEVTRQKRPIPGLDVEALGRKYGGDPGNTTQSVEGTFKVPMGIGWSRWEKYRNTAAERFVSMLERQGWVIERVEARPGTYPYRDVLTGKDDPAYREMRLVVTGGYPKAESVVVELDPEDVQER